MSCVVRKRTLWYVGLWTWRGLDKVLKYTIQSCWAIWASTIRFEKINIFIIILYWKIPLKLFLIYCTPQKIKSQPLLWDKPKNKLARNRKYPFQITPNTHLQGTGPSHKNTFSPHPHSRKAFMNKAGTASPSPPETKFCRRSERSCWRGNWFKGEFFDFWRNRVFVLRRDPETMKWKDSRCVKYEKNWQNIAIGLTLIRFWTDWLKNQYLLISKEKYKLYI